MMCDAAWITPCEFEGESICTVIATAGIRNANVTQTHISAPAHSWSSRGPDGRAEEWKDRVDRQVDYKTQGTLKECHKAAWQGRGTKPWTIEVTASHSAKTARWATRTKGPPSEKTHPQCCAPIGTACPTETQPEDAVQLPRPYLPANTTPDS
jgi:hypothetical protein